MPEQVCHQWESFTWTTDEAENFVMKVTGELEHQEEKDHNPIFYNRKLPLQKAVTG